MIIELNQVEKLLQVAYDELSKIVDDSQGYEVEDSLGCVAEALSIIRGEQ